MFAARLLPVEFPVFTLSLLAIKCSCSSSVNVKESTCNFILGKFALAIVLVLLPPVVPLAIEPEVDKRNLPSIFSQVVPKYLVAGLLDKVVIQISPIEYGQKFLNFFLYF